MTYTVDQLVVVERTLDRALNAAMTFADKETKAQLADASYLFTELRHAAVCLVDADEDGRREIAHRLFSLFATAPFKVQPHHTRKNVWEVVDSRDNTLHGHHNDESEAKRYAAQLNQSRGLPI